MEASIECTHCGVVMTSWAAPGSTIRYYQCPFCARTHSSLYGEVFRRRAGARVVGAVPPPAAPSAMPMPTADDMHWARVKATAARWFARLEANERLNGEILPRAARLPPRRAAEQIPEACADDVFEVVAAAAGRKG
jgi:hypothetical protein